MTEKKTKKFGIEHYCNLVLSRQHLSPENIKQQHLELKIKSILLTDKQITEAKTLAASGWTNKAIEKHFLEKHSFVGWRQILKHCKGIKRVYRDGG